MTKSFPKRVSFRTGVVRSSSVSYVLSEDSDIMDEGAAHTVLLTWKNGKWLRHVVDWIANSVCVRQTPIEQVVMIGEDGEFLVGGGGGNLIEGEIPLDEGGKRGPLRSVRAIEGVPYAVGMGGVVFRQDKPDFWVRIDKGIPKSQHLESIAGFSSDDIYAVGRKGVVWHFDKGKWHRIVSPTNVILTSVCCADDGNVYACGLNGTLIKGRGNDWQVIEQQDVDLDIWDVEWFKGKLYISTMMCVYELEGENLKYVFDKNQPKTTYHLSSSDEVMWSIGGRDIMEFDGKCWNRIE